MHLFSSVCVLLPVMSQTLHCHLVVKPAMLNATLKSDEPVFSHQVYGSEIVWSEFVYVGARVPE